MRLILKATPHLKGHPFLKEGEEVEVEHIATTVNIIPIPSRIQGGAMNLTNIATMVVGNVNTQEVFLVPMDGTVEIKMKKETLLRKVD